MKFNKNISKKYLIVFMILVFSFNSGIFIKTLDNFQTGTNKSSATSANDLTAVNTRNSLTADTTAPSINATYTPYKYEVNNTVIQSPHNYPDNANLTWTVSKPGVTSITLFFTNISVESCCDYVNIYNSSWILQDQFHSQGTYYNQKITVNSDTVYIVLTSDYSVTYYGFYITNETYYTQYPDQTSYTQNAINSYNVSYIINEANPANYELYQNHNLVANNSYTANQTFSFVFTNLTLNTNNFTLVAFDTSGNNASVQKIFQINPDTTPPSISATYRPISEIVNTTVIQSPHNYPNNANMTWTVSKPGVKYITLFFNNISVESCCDYLNIYNSSWSLQDQFHSAQNYYNQSVTVNSDTVYIVLTSDSSVNYYGFYIANVTYYTPFPDSSTFSQYSINKYDISYSINEVNPAYYELYQNNSLVANGSYFTNQTFSFSFTNLHVTTYNFTLVAFDTFGNNASIQKIFQIIPYTESPTIQATYEAYHSYISPVSIESSHSYRSFTTKTWDITNTGAIKLSLYFTEISLSDSYENLSIYDANWNLVQYYSGPNYYTSFSKYDFWLAIDSGSAHIILSTSAGYMYGYGFSISSIKYQTSLKTSSSYYNTQLTSLNLVYNITEEYSSYYLLWQNGTLIKNSTYYTNFPVYYTFNNPAIGSYNFTLVAYGLNGYHSSTQYFVSIIPAPNPVFTSQPKSIFLTESNKTGTLSWTLQSQNATYYVIYLNGIRIVTGNYINNEQINYTINYNYIYLNNGTNTFIIIAYNALGGQARESININVFKPYNPIVSSTSTTSTTSSSIIQTQPTSKNSKATPYPFFASILGLLFSIILIKRRRKRLS